MRWVGFAVDMSISETVSGPLAEQLPVSAELEEGFDRQILIAVLERFHYLGHSTPVGESIGHLMRDGRGRIVGGSLTRVAAWRYVARVRWIGRTEAARLVWVANQQRFLVFDADREPHLASHVLVRIARRLSADYEDRYGHPVHLLKTPVDWSRFTGACYRAVGCHDAGVTTGRRGLARLHVEERCQWALL